MSKNYKNSILLIDFEDELQFNQDTLIYNPVFKLFISLQDY